MLRVPDPPGLWETRSGSATSPRAQPGRNQVCTGTPSIRESIRSASGRCFRVTQPDAQGARADRALQFPGRAFGDHLAGVDHGDPIGELVRLVQVLRGQEHRRPSAARAADDVPDLVAAARIEPGRRLVEEEQVRRDDDPGRDVEPPPHAPGVGLYLLIRRLGEPERVEQFLGPPLRLPA